MTERAKVWRAPGMLELAVLSVFGFSGYAALLAVAPLWAVHGGATTAGSGLVNGVLLAATILAQLAVPRALAAWSEGRVLVAGLLLLGVPAPGYLLSDGLGWILALSAVRGLGFGILTVVGSTVVAHLVPASRRGAAIGVYGLAVAVPNLLLLPGSVPVVDRWGFEPVFWAAALPVLGVPPALRLARILRDTGHGRPAGADEGPRVRLRALRGILLADPGAVQRHHGRGCGTDLRSPVDRSRSRGAGAADHGHHYCPVALADRRARGSAWRPALPRPHADLRRSRYGDVRVGGGAVSRDIALIAAATVLGLCYGALQNLTLVVAFAAVEPPQLPAASAGWNIGFDAGTASGAVLAGVLAAAYSFPVSLATLAALCLLTAVVTVATQSPRQIRR